MDSCPHDAHSVGKPKLCAYPPTFSTPLDPQFLLLTWQHELDLKKYGVMLELRAGRFLEPESDGFGLLLTSNLQEFGDGLGGEKQSLHWHKQLFYLTHLLQASHHAWLN